MKTALKIYNELIDMDYNDYFENLESDLLFIKTVIDNVGEKNARLYLEELLTM